MNGNKLNIILLATLLLTMQSCFLFQKTTKEEPDKPAPREDTTQVARDTLPYVDTTEQLPTPEDFRKPYYKVAVLLPFYLDNKYLIDLDEEERTYEYRSMVTTEYLQGLLIGFNHLKEDSVKLEVTFHDTRNDSISIKGLLKEPHLKEQDLIIGPLFPQNLGLVSEFARKHEIMLVSPLSSKVMIPDTNSYYINASPSRESHGQAIARYAANHFRGHPITIFHTSDSAETALAKSISRTFLESSPFMSEGRPIQMKELGMDAKFDSTLLMRNDTNIIILPSQNEIFVTNVLRELNNQTVGQAMNLESGENHEIDYRVKPEQLFVFGFSSWIKDFNSLRFDYLNSINFYATRSFKYDTASEAYQHFAQDFIDTFDYAPSTFAMKAYDLIHYMGNMLHEYGTATREYFPYYHHVPINGYINFQPVYIYGEDPNKELLHYYENRFVHMMRYNDYTLKPAPSFFAK